MASLVGQLEAQAFLGAVLLLLLAHVGRALRWSFLFPRNSLDRRRPLLIGLGFGYAVNALLPFRVGEIVRGLVVSGTAGVRFAYVLATIVAERLADLIVLALLLMATARFSGEPSRIAATAAVFATAALALVAASVALRRSARIRQWVWRAAGLFNERIQLGVADFLWSAAEMIVGRHLLRWRFLVATAGMWIFYLAAYGIFAVATQARLLDVIARVLQHPLGSLVLAQQGTGSVSGQLPLFLFVLIPVLLILGYGLLMRSRAFASAAESILRHGKSGRGAAKAHRESFGAPSSYESFLNAHFSGTSRAISGFGIEAIRDCIVHRFFAGGSDAVTALVESDKRMAIRKFAVGAAAAKLKVQADWLERHAHADFPLAKVIGERQTSSVYSYDMPVITPFNDFYDVIHSSGPEHRRGLLEQVITCIDGLHHRTRAGSADPERLTAYLATKATENALLILDVVRSSLEGDDYSINGEPYSLGEWDFLARPDWLLDQVKQRDVATIHGDLTIENVIIAPRHPFGLYIIDPNPENIFDGPLLDWGKLMQSLHLGYETLNRGLSLAQDGNALRLTTPRSQAYAELHELLEAQIIDRFGADGLREVYFHELVHYLRLTPYKLRQSRTRGMGFFACTSMLLRQYRGRWP